MRKLKVIDLCCGAGGFSEGFRQAGFEIILGIDIWGDALESFKRNQKCDVLEIDINNLNYLPKCDVLIGSPPCQCFSIQKFANKNHKEPDISIFGKFLDLREICKAKYWIWENTPLSAKYIDLPHNFLDAQNYGVPQRRKRVFYGNYPIPKQKEKADTIAPTIMAWELCGGWKNNRGRRFSQWLNRKPTLDEMKYYMGFPEDYEIFGNKHSSSLQIGNAVCPPVSKVIAEEIKTQYDMADTCGASNR